VIRAVALGYQGYGNVGDEAILTGIEELLSGTEISVQAVIGGPEPIAGFPEARRVITRSQRPNLAGLRELRRSRLLLLSGGGLLNDHWPVVVPTYLAWTMLARLSGCRVAWLGVGVGPLRTVIARLLAGMALHLSRLVAVRDEASLQLAREIASGVAARVVPDPAIFNAPPAEPTTRHGVGIVVRGPTPRDAALADPLATALGDAAARLAREGRDVRLLTFAGSRDGPFAAKVMTQATAHGETEPMVEELGPDPAAVLTRLAELDAVIAVRLHGLILAALARTPALPIAYDQKVASWAHQLDLGDVCVAIGELSAVGADGLLERLGQVSAPDRRRRVQDRLTALRAQASPLTATLLEFAT
jgi:polysaccharide pyruvyl transferase WcaK-like protein